MGGDIEVATRALLRMIHRTKPSNPLFDPAHPDFDADPVLAHAAELRDRPFVEVVADLQSFVGSAPFLPERCAALRS